MTEGTEFIVRDPKSKREIRAFAMIYAQQRSSDKLILFTTENVDTLRHGSFLFMRVSGEKYPRFRNHQWYKATQTSFDGDRVIVKDYVEYIDFWQRMKEHIHPSTSVIAGAVSIVLSLGTLGGFGIVSFFQKNECEAQLKALQQKIMQQEATNHPNTDHSSDNSK